MKRQPGRWERLVLALILLFAGVAILSVGLGRLWHRGGHPFLARSTDTPAPTATEPILPPPPTPTPTPVPAQTEQAVNPAPPATTATAAAEVPLASATAQETAQPTLPATPRLPATATSTAPPAPTLALQGLFSLQQRLGVSGGMGQRGPELVHLLRFGWYVDWTVRADAFQAPGVEYMPMVRLYDGKVTPGTQELLRAAAALPGALWLIGNEPDVKWQDNVEPEAYAQLYHELYTLLKEHDPSCSVAIGGVSQPTPLRLRYLDRILQAYEDRYSQPMPVDVWNVHNFILHEERGSWGVDIPPGMPDDTGRLYEIADHDDLDIFRRQIVEFRRWMKERGQQGKPLIITEYGILMPTEYGFPAREVERFMLDSFEFFRTASDQRVGYPADGYRLVQRWCWFSLADQRYPTGNLLGAAGGGLTSLGEAFARYAAPKP